MNIKTINKGSLLESAVDMTKLKIQDYSNARILGARFNSIGDPIVSVEVKQRTNTNSYSKGFYMKHLEFTVKGNTVYPILPIKALCDE
tara:strand:- start:999 stop:1262 length:264 start_codon:yes stop_codon:yes gene_type:complete